MLDLNKSEIKIGIICDTVQSVENMTRSTVRTFGISTANFTLPADRR